MDLFRLIELGEAQVGLLGLTDVGSNRLKTGVRDWLPISIECGEIKGRIRQPIDADSSSGRSPFSFRMRFESISLSSLFFSPFPNLKLAKFS